MKWVALRAALQPCPQALISQEKGGTVEYVGVVKESLVHTDLCVGGNYYVFSLMTLVATLAMSFT